MANNKFGSLVRSIKGSILQASIDLISLLTVQAMKFSIKTTLKVVVILFLPSLSFLLFS